MHFTRLASICLGAWLAGNVLILVMANQNAPAIEDLVLRPSLEASKVVVKLAPTQARALFRNFSAELDSRLRWQWENIEIGLGVTILISLFLGSSGKRYPGVLCLLMLGCVCFLHWFVRPEMEKLVPGVDFVQDARERFGALSSAYSTTVYVKLALGFAAAFGLAKRRRRHVPADSV
jgi:hypothetical protein